MDTTSIICYIALGLLLWFFVNHSMKTWFRRNEGTGKEVDLDTIGRNVPYGFGARGDAGDPEMITRLEEKLKNPENTKYKK